MEVHTILERARMEQWKPIEDLKGYSISNKGRVRKDSTGQIMVLSQNNGYVRITISKHIHRLVADAFLEKPQDENKCWIDHIDGNRSNNDVSNLRWVTPSENTMAYGYHSRIEKKKRKVKAVHKSGKTIIFNSRVEASEYFKCSDSEIHYNREFAKGNKKGWTLYRLDQVKDEDIV